MRNKTATESTGPSEENMRLWATWWPRPLTASMEGHISDGPAQLIEEPRAVCEAPPADQMLELHSPLLPHPWPAVWPALPLTPSPQHRAYSFLLFLRLGLPAHSFPIKILQTSPASFSLMPSTQYKIERVDLKSQSHP